MATSEDEKQPELDHQSLDLAEDQLAVLDQQVETPKSNAGYFAIFRYAEALDVLFLTLSGIVAAGAGATLPLMTIVLGSLVGQFSDLSSLSNLDFFVDEVNSSVRYFVYIGVGILALSSLFVSGFTWTGSRITKRLRSAYFEALLGQNIAFLDSLGAGEVAARVTADMNLVQDGISQKVGLAISGIASFVASLVIAFVKSWRLALVMLCLPVAITCWMAITGTSMKKEMVKSSDLQMTAASFAEEAISSVNNVAAYGLQKRFAQKYEESLISATTSDFKAKSFLGLLIGGMMGLTLSAFALACWAGSRFMAAGDITTSEIVTVLFASVIAGVAFGQITPHLESFGAAGTAANRIIATIERKSLVSHDAGGNSDHPKGQMNGHIQFRNVQLVYPARRNQLILDDFTLDIHAGQTTAIVGPSGSGKSSLFHLLQRFYLPLDGSICIDGKDIGQLDLKWMRSRMRVVAQDAFLFKTTIFENIAFGLTGSTYETENPQIKQQLVENAAKAANAHDFILALPSGYNTNVGEGGNMLSGGQRQRVAIARALISEPQILLLDEATSALDTKSESLVQGALRRRNESGRYTTVIVAHRLSTVRHADNIIVMEHGRIAEQGTHEQLMARNGAYMSLVAAQQLQQNEDEQEGEYSHEGKQVTKLSKSNSWKGEAGASTDIDTLPAVGESSTVALVSFLLKLNGPERPFLVIGLIGSIFSGMAYPLTGIFFGNMILALRDPSATLGHHGINFWAGWQFFTGCIVLLGYVLQSVPFAYASSRLISRARSVAFAVILRQDAAFFAHPENSSGALTAFLAQQANQLNGLSGTILGALCNSTVAVVAGFIVAISFGWKLGLVGLATMPLIFITGYARYRALASLEKKNLQATYAASMVAEVIRGIRTIASLGLEDTVAFRYRQQLTDEGRTALLKNILLSVLYGTSQSVIVFCMAIVFWYGGTRLLPTGEYTVQSFLICFVATQYSAQSAGGVFSYAPDVAGAKTAAAHLKRLCETEPHIDVDAETGMSAEELKGEMALRNIDFSYPSPENKASLVLQNVTLTASTGQFIALVGTSGSGKSSVLRLLERLFDPQSGSVLADERDIRTYNLQGYRRQLAIVEQDAVLYSGTIRDNIVSEGHETDDKIKLACQDANIWDFIESMPSGLNTLVGPRGIQVSGGQKQRLAIARAILRNPKVLLLDEATSALDSHSEAVVQQSLAAAAIGRTTISVAHRLSSIAHADCIFVFDNGKVVEQGTHGGLMKKRGRYWEFVGLQSLGH